jgi:hypothetical protein
LDLKHSIERIVLKKCMLSSLINKEVFGLNGITMYYLFMNHGIKKRMTL